MKMKRFGATLTIALTIAFAPTWANAQQMELTDAARDKIKAEVTAFLVSYVASFSDQDVKTIAEKVYANPSFSLSAKGIIALSSDQLAANFAGAFKELEKEQYDHSELSAPWVCVLNAKNAIAGGKFKRIRKDGSVLLDAAASYLFIDTSEGWRIAGPIGIGKSTTVSCN